MIKLIITENGIININDDDEMLNYYQSKGLKILDETEINKFGLKGYEKYISPYNTTIDENGNIYFDKSKIEESMASNIRWNRKLLLKETDVYMTEDYPIDQEKKEKIKKYRQELRDITKHSEFPLFLSTNGKVPWPKKEWEAK